MSSKVLKGPQFKMLYKDHIMQHERRAERGHSSSEKEKVILGHVVTVLTCLAPKVRSLPITATLGNLLSKGITGILTCHS